VLQSPEQGTHLSLRSTFAKFKVSAELEHWQRPGLQQAQSFVLSKKQGHPRDVKMSSSTAVGSASCFAITVFAQVSVSVQIAQVSPAMPPHWQAFSAQQAHEKSSGSSKQGHPVVVTVTEFSQWLPV